MKIVFLDIDGVILPVDALPEVNVYAARRDPFGHLDLIDRGVERGAVRNLITLAETTGARFVLISNWRELFSDRFLETFLERIGLWPYYFHSSRGWKAPMRGFPPRSNKGRDIGMWLTQHRVPQHKCLVIDDSELYLREIYGFRVLKQIQPNSRTCFSVDDLAAAVRVLAPQLNPQVDHPLTTPEEVHPK